MNHFNGDPSFQFDHANISEQQALLLANETDTAGLMAMAAKMRDQHHGKRISYSRKVFIPLTHLCRDVCHYCTFAKTPKQVESPYLSIEQTLEIARRGVQMGCTEALLTLGERPELRYRAAREALQQLGFSSTLEYLAEVSSAILAETGLLPHLNSGCMDREELNELRKCSISMGMMLESSSERLSERGKPHFGSPDKNPAARIATLRAAGEIEVPFTTGILIGIGETRRERIEALLIIRQLHQQYGHIQEVIIQNFRAKPGTLMATAPEPDLNELLWTLAISRIVLGAEMNIQVPPNLSPGVLSQLIGAGINDWGGVSPVTPDHVNPEAPWPHLTDLANQTESTGKQLVQRAPVYPSYAKNTQQWVDKKNHKALLIHLDGSGYIRDDSWLAGTGNSLPETYIKLPSLKIEKKNISAKSIDPTIRDIVNRAAKGELITELELELLFHVRGDDLDYVIEAADQLRKEVNGEVISYVVNRNINYTNICYFHCGFCAFAKGKVQENLRDKPYKLGMDEIARRALEAQKKGATEVCLQGGIHPDYTGETYLQILKAVKQAAPNLHIHAFSPLEVWQGASTLGLSIDDFLAQLKAAGLNSMPGTAAEILDERIRSRLSPDKINTDQWCSVISSAHQQGIDTTSTIMFGHLDGPEHWARHLVTIRQLQQKAEAAGLGVIKEFVPLPFVHMESPLFRKGKARQGPSFRETILMHAVARLGLHPHIKNIQVSWPKLGRQGAEACLKAGANDLGGTLMNESISRAAGASVGQEMTSAMFERWAQGIDRKPRQRRTNYSWAEEPGLVARTASSNLQRIL
ncbi:MAG: 5-amino-6-(D-ribitylamino)uracil--L-tyrosine 4-hydroxyphenyl transferase CofH [Pseudomonadales bacterium]|nr:5-amino-6-(D-ribitylamino)uracil--L-tyrosine 4-hydroxyphenyl transferase CofH [Pseudomonadales bacterium]